MRALDSVRRTAVTSDPSRRSRGVIRAPVRAEDGFSLIELLIVAGLMVFVVFVFFGMVTNIARGWALLQGQLDTQQNPRVATDRAVNDLQQSLEYAMPSGAMTVQKITILTCGMAFPTSTSTVLVENPTDLQVNSVVTLTALSTQITRTVTAISTTATTCTLSGISGTGTQLTLDSAITSATAPFGVPYGTLLAPIPVTYTQSATQMLRAGAILADNVATLSFTEHATTLSAQANADASTITVSSATPLAVGDLIFIDAGNSNAEIRAISSIATNTVTLDQHLFVTHTLGAPVHRKLAATQVVDQITQTQLGGSQVQSVTLPSEGAPRNPPLK